VDVRYPVEAEEFRVEVRDFLAAHLPDNWPGMGALDREEAEAFAITWRKTLYDHGFLGIAWPREFGGGGRTKLEQVVLTEELARARVPFGRATDTTSVKIMGNTLLRWGTDEQKQQFLPRILSGEDIWVQGFSEPDAGSDLANLKLVATRDGDSWVLNGQKLWTSRAQEGISYLLCPMRQPGIEVRAIEQIDGSAEFCEVFFTDARCPKDNVLSEVNRGWSVAKDTLGFERGTSATTGYRRFEKELEVIIDRARANGKIDDPVVRQNLAKAYSKVQIMRINGLRTLSAVVSAKKDKSVAALGLTNKMFWSEYHQEVMNLAIDILGMEGQILTGDPASEEAVPGYGARRTPERYPASVLQSAFFFSRSETIWGGTSQIQRNIVGEAFLGLPREPKPTSA